jgi:hypothetical protein
MASNGDSRGGLLTAGGVLSIVGGTLEVVGGLIIVALSIGVRILSRLAVIPFHPGGWLEHITGIAPYWFIIVGGPLLALGIVAIVGGVSAVRRRSFGLSLAGAICALPSNILGILAIIFVSVSKKEFEAKD